MRLLDSGHNEAHDASIAAEDNEPETKAEDEEPEDKKPDILNIEEIRCKRQRGKIRGLSLGLRQFQYG